jgi:hypothetical protein
VGRRAACGAAGPPPQAVAQAAGGGGARARGSRGGAQGKEEEEEEEGETYYNSIIKAEHLAAYFRFGVCDLWHHMESGWAVVCLSRSVCRVSVLYRPRPRAARGAEMRASAFPHPAELSCFLALRLRSCVFTILLGFFFKMVGGFLGQCRFGCPPPQGARECCHRPP